MIVGYSRVSTDGQTLYAQQAALRDTEVVDVFAPPREDFLAGGTRLICVHHSTPAMLRGGCARSCNRFIVPFFVISVNRVNRRKKLQPETSRKMLDAGPDAPSCRTLPRSIISAPLRTSRTMP